MTELTKDIHRWLTMDEEVIPVSAPDEVNTFIDSSVHTDFNNMMDAALCMHVDGILSALRQEDITQAQRLLGGFDALIQVRQFPIALLELIEKIIRNREEK